MIFGTGGGLGTPQPMGSQTPKQGCWEALGPIGGGAPRPKSFLESLYRPKYKYNLQISCIVYNFHRFFEPNVILLKLLLVTHRVKGKRLWWRPKHWKNFNVLVYIQVTWYYKWEFHCTYWNFKLLTHLTHPIGYKGLHRHILMSNAEKNLNV